MAIEVYINFDGNCREAVTYYAEIFKTEKPNIMTFSDGPQNPDFPIPEEAKNRVMHTELTIFGSRVMFSDTFPGWNFVQGNNISITIISNDTEAITNAFHKLKEEGKVGMDLQVTFWSKLYGTVTDKFGISWQFSHEEE